LSRNVTVTLAISLPRGERRSEGGIGFPATPERTGFTIAFGANDASKEMPMKPTLTAFVLLLLAGCGSASPTPTPTPTPTDTPQRFASIVSGNESDWREVIDNAGSCRFLWVEGGKSPADKANAMSCYAREATIVISAGTAAKELRGLNPSPEIQELVTETLSALDGISSVDLEGVCGETFGDDSPRGTTECNQTQGELYKAYLDLKAVLDKWKPYT
jgi:hypothetical protein